MHSAGLYNYEVASYKDYKNKSFTKNKDKLKNILWGIRQNSLKPEDKKKLKEELLEMISDFKI